MAKQHRLLQKDEPDRDARPWVNTMVIAREPRWVWASNTPRYYVGFHHGEYLTFPGGRVNVFEHMRHAASREFREETGLNTEITQCLGVFEDVRPDDDYHKIVIVFEGIVISGEPKPRDDLQDLTCMTLLEVRDHPEAAPLVQEIVRSVYGKVHTQHG